MLSRAVAIKVFWFFFSKKNTLSAPALATGHGLIRMILTTSASGPIPTLTTRASGESAHKNKG